MTHSYMCNGCNGTGRDASGRVCERCAGTGQLEAAELPPGSDPFKDEGSE
jgi:DnaJ-class molecular chaperone